MQRIARPLVTSLFTIIAISAASAGPLGPIFDPVNEPPPARVQQTSASNAGGGFLEFLFGGPSPNAARPAPDYTRHEPLEPQTRAGVPAQPGMDPRFLKQE